LGENIASEEIPEKKKISGREDPPTHSAKKKRVLCHCSLYCAGAKMNRSLDERNRLSFFSPHYLEASGHLSTSTTTSSPLASLEDLQSCHDDVHFGQEDLLRIKAHRVAATSSPPPHHQYQQSSGEGPPPPPPPPPAAAAQEGQWAENEDYKDDDDDEVGHGWANQRKHFFILSNAGKPIYSRYSSLPSQRSFVLGYDCPPRHSYLPWSLHNGWVGADMATSKSCAR